MDIMTTIVTADQDADIDMPSWAELGYWRDDEQASGTVDGYLDGVLDEDPGDEFDQICDEVLSEYWSAVDDILAPYRTRARERLEGVYAEWRRKVWERDFDDARYAEAYTAASVDPDVWDESVPAQDMSRLVAWWDALASATTLDAGDARAINAAIGRIDPSVWSRRVVLAHRGYFRKHRKPAE